MSDPVTIDWEQNWETRLLNRLYVQFRDAASWRLWVTGVIAPQITDLENAAQSLLTLLDIDNSEGVQLDTIGRIVGQPRLGTDDVTYRTYLKARIQTNRSDGSAEDLYDVFRALYGSAIGFLCTTSQIGIREFALRVKHEITDAQGNIGVGFLRDAKEAGARAILKWPTVPSTNLFTYNGNSGYQGYGYPSYFALVPTGGLYPWAKQP